MIYPNFLKKGDLIGITALSSGCIDVIDELNTSIKNLEKEYQVIVTNDVYGDKIVSASVDIRVKELKNLLKEDIKLLYIARGGDYLKDCLPYINFKEIVKKRIWVQGYSDPTSLLYILTTKYDLATIYGINGKGYSEVPLLKYQRDNLEIIKGNKIVQESYMDRITISSNDTFTSQGMIIGGCIEVLNDIFKTPFDNTVNFIEKYKDQKIIWYFDIYNISSNELYEILDKFNKSSWFKYTNTVIFGTVFLPNSSSSDYYKAVQKVFNNKDYNIIFNANIGHVRPSFTIINGSIGTISFSDNKLSIKQDVDI